MKLYEVPNNTKIRVISEARTPASHRDFESEEILDFHHIDGMYSFCKDKDGNTVHLAAWTEVEIVENSPSENSRGAE